MKISSSFCRLGVSLLSVVGASCLATSCAPAQSTASTRTLDATQRTAAATVAKQITNNGVALVPIVVSAQGTPREKAAAQTLADNLKRISGATFTITNSAQALTTSTNGIAVGLSTRFSPAPAGFVPSDPTKSEDYLLRSHSRGVTIIGASEQALELAVWDFLYRFGYRQFFPGAKWEVVPQAGTLTATLNIFDHPDYYARSIWYGYGTLPENVADTAQWSIRNRVTRGIMLNTGHAYDAIINRHLSEFQAHPEYLTKPRQSLGNKFCVSNAGLRQLVIDDAVAQFAANPALQSVSLEPSDGGGWDSGTCNDAQTIGSPSNRVVTLANAVATATAAQYPNKYFGVYAYNEHSPAPTIAVNPRVVVSIATAYINGGATIDGLLNGWSSKASLLGIREYLSVNAWDRDLPGQARGGNLAYLQSTIPDFYAKKSRFYSAESSDNWGPNGLGYYLASRMLWHVSDTSQIAALKTDFFTRAFGSASAEMSVFYNAIDGTNTPLLSRDLIGRMYRQLQAAFAKTSDNAVRARLEDLTLYTRYVELYYEYSQASGGARQAAFESLMRFSWRIRTTHMIHTLGLWRDLDGRDPQVSFPAGVAWDIPEPQNPWKSSVLYGSSEIQTFIAQGVANNPLLPFTAKAFSRDLIPATPLHLTSGAAGKFTMMRGTQDFYTWVGAPATISLQAAAGQIYTNRGDAVFSLFPAAETQGASVDLQSTAPDKVTRTISLTTSFTGLHRINARDANGGTVVNWTAGTPMTVESSPSVPITFTGGRWTMYFYVPKGTQTVGGYRTGEGQLLNASGQVALTMTGLNPEYWSVAVPAGQDGKLWCLSNVSGKVMPMTVPPYLARSAQELLLPREVIQADSP